jgi:hypothetical protein
MSKEEIYDNEISPLMTKIIAICKKHKIAMLADFKIGDDEEQGSFHCSTALLTDQFNPSETQLAANRELQRKPVFMTFTVHTKQASEGP